LPKQLPPSNNHVVFRVDAGARRGLSFGHLYRCMEIALELRAVHGHRCVFAMRDIAEGVRVARGSGNEVVTIPEDLSFEDEISILSELPGNIVVFDLIDAESRDMSRLHQIGKRTLALDDYGNKRIDTHAVINGSIVPHMDNCSSPNIIGQQKFFGPNYCVIGKSFGEARRAAVSDTARRILLTFGGSDPTGLTEKTAAALADLPDGFEIRVLVGPGYNFKTGLAKTQHQNKSCNYQIKENVPDMVSEILWADLVITAGGRTVYEIAATGTPMILIPSIEHEEPVAATMAELGAGINLGRWTRSTKKKLLNDITRLVPKNVREQMHLQGPAIIDGRGLERVCALITEFAGATSQAR